MRCSFLPFPLSLVLLTGCPHKTPSGPTSPADAAIAAMQRPEVEGCPAPLLPFDSAQCSATGTRGLSPEAPLEWGPGAAGNSELWMGRLTCPSGAMADSSRIGNIGAAPVASTSPSSGVPSMGVDILDVWAVQCPGAPEQKWYASMYRCGELCPPQGFQILPADAYIAMMQTQQALQDNDADAAIAAAAAAAVAAPDFELPYFVQAATHMAASDPAGALVAFEQAARFAPDRISSLYPRIVLLREAGRVEEANPLALRLLDLTPPDHPERAPAACMAALAHLDQGDEEQGRTLAAESCDAGFTLCCTIR